MEMVMDEEKLSDLVKKAIIDRLEGWELIEFLQIDIETVVDTFEDEILDNITDVLELINMESEEEDE